MFKWLFHILIFATSGKYQNKEKPLKCRRKLGLILYMVPICPLVHEISCIQEVSGQKLMESAPILICPPPLCWGPVCGGGGLISVNNIILTISHFLWFVYLCPSWCHLSYLLGYLSVSVIPCSRPGASRSRDWDSRSARSALIWPSQAVVSQSLSDRGRSSRGLCHEWCLLCLFSWRKKNLECLE